MTSDLLLGIDLGTSNTAAFVVGADFPKPRALVCGKNSDIIMPSVVSFKNRKIPLVGAAARDMMLTDPLTTVYGWKRFLGLRASSEYVYRYRDRLPYRMEEDADQKLGAVINGEVISFEHVASLVLKEIRLRASGAISRDMRDCVISIPAHFGKTQRESIQNAAIEAGLNVLQLINEPTAAAVTFGMNRGLEARILIYDLGGGTFDVTLMEVCNDVFEVKATAGEAFLGGIDFDQKIVGFLQDKCMAEYKIDPLQDPVIAQRVYRAAENAKCLLSEGRSVKVRIPMIGFDRIGQSVHLETLFTRPDLERLTAPLVEQTLGLVDKILGDAKLEKSDIDFVVMVGGQSKMPLVVERVQSYFQKPPYRHLDPDTCVAHGAALLARNLGLVSGAVLLDVLSVPIGIVKDGKQEILFTQNTSLPAKTRISLGDEPYAEPVSIGFWQGTDVTSSDRQFLGTAKLPPFLFESGIGFGLDIKVLPDLSIEVSFSSTAHKNVFLNLE